jgi:glycosyltransferase involved in cell wall biosynthesis
MRVVFVTHYSAMLGANRSLVHLVTGLRREFGVEPLVLCPSAGPLTETLEGERIPFLIRPFANGAYTLRTPSLYAFPWRWYDTCRHILPELTAALRAFDADLIHSNSSAVALGWQLSETLQKPHVWHIREFGTVDYRLIYPLGKKRYFEKLQNAAAIILISEALRETLPKNLRPPVRVVYNGIGTELQLREAREAALGQASDGLFRFLLIGLLHPQKRQHEAIRAFGPVARRHAHARLIIAGDGRKSYERRLRSMVVEAGLEGKVEFTGYVPSPAPLYRSADAVLMCSHFEAMGRVTAEAMAHGKPVIGFDGGATPELIRHESTGLLYKTTIQLTDRMTQLIENQDLKNKIGNNAHRFALEMFTDERYVTAVYDVFKQSSGC